MIRKLALVAILVVAVIAGLALTGHLPFARKAQQAAVKPTVAPPIAVTVAQAKPTQLVQSVLVTGTLVPREEILVGPEIEGLRVVEVLVDEGDRVTKGQVLARLVSATIEAQLAQNDAALARARASIAQAQSNIEAAQARLVEARNAYNRAKPLSQSGVLSESGMDQRVSAAKTAEANLAVAKDGLKLAQAELAQIEAQRRDLEWRRQKTQVVAPADGLVSRRVVRVGGYATGVAEPMFRIVAKGEIELDAEVTEGRLAEIKPGQKTTVEVAGVAPVPGEVRLVSPEIDKATRLGRIRIFLGDNPVLRIGAFARATIVTATSRGLAIPASAVLYTHEGATVQVVVDNRIATRRVKLGLAQDNIVEVREGLKEGEAVVAKSGTFLREGDAVRAITTPPTRTGAAG